MQTNLDNYFSTAAFGRKINDMSVNVKTSSPHYTSRYLPTVGCSDFGCLVSFTRYLKANMQITYFMRTLLFSLQNIIIYYLIYVDTININKLLLNNFTYVTLLFSY